MACFVVPFLILWVLLFACQTRFQLLTAPAALARWAEVNGFRIERKATPFILLWPRSWRNSGSCRKVYRVTVLDRDRHSIEAWVRLGGALAVVPVGRGVPG